MGALIAGGAGIAGGLADMFGSGRRNRAMMRWHEKMASTAWQRGVDDMRRAGINPLAAFGSAAAATPGVSLENTMEGVGGGVSSAGQMLGLERQRMRAEIAATKQQGDAAESQGRAALINSTTNALAEQRNEAVFKRDTPWLELVRWLEANQRNQDIITSTSSNAMIRKQIQALEADLSSKEFESKGFEAAERRIEELFKPGVMQDAARIMLMILKSRVGSSAIQQLGIGSGHRRR